MTIDLLYEILREEFARLQDCDESHQRVYSYLVVLKDYMYHSTTWARERERFATVLASR